MQQKACAAKVIRAPKFRVDTIISELPNQERLEKSRKLKKTQSMRGVLFRMRRSDWGDGYSPNADSLHEIAKILEVSIDSLYTSNPEQDAHLPH